MIYAMMYKNAEGKLEILRYDSDTRMYQFTAGEISEIAAKTELPADGKVVLSYEVDAREAAENKLPDIPQRKNASARWLKPIGEFSAANDIGGRPGKFLSHAYVMIEQLHKDRAIPGFFDNIISVLKQQNILNDDGKTNQHMEKSMSMVIPPPEEKRVLH